MNILVTGSSGLIGSEAVLCFERQGHRVFGFDNNMRADFFGPQGDTCWNLKRLLNETRRFEHYDMDIRDRVSVLAFFEGHPIDAIIHCAAQPSHDLAKNRPFDDFEVNATGTLNLLEATRRYCPESPFIFMSTNKVYGDAPNELPLVEKEKRWDYAQPEDHLGIDETMRIDQSRHSLFGTSKLAADVLTQEYGRYFGIPTVCFRAGCMTGPRHSSVELHGFLSYIVKAAMAGLPYTIFGYKGKQVRDQIHSYDVVRACEVFIQSPRVAEVYNLGGGRESNISILECVDLIEELSGIRLQFTYTDNARSGDHICYISNLSKFKQHYPNWSLTYNVNQIVQELIEFEQQKQG